jgi:hypothetical protein
VAVVHRKSAPDVRNGRVQKKNNHLAHPGLFFRVPENEIPVLHERPGPGYRHVLTTGNVIHFLEILPPALSELLDGVRAIVLAPGEPGLFGRYKHTGVISLHAWPRGLTDYLEATFYEDNRELLERLGLEVEPYEAGWYIAHWTEEQARAFLLLDVLPHEIGHHADRMTSKRRRECGRGEPFAETFAREMLPELWDRYWRAIRR